MTPRERAIASRRAQGLPPSVTDPGALARIAALLRSPATSQPRQRERGAA